MALIICPECNNKVSNTAVHCPHCGAQVGRTDYDKFFDDVATSYIIAIVIVGSALLFIIYGDTSNIDFGHGPNSNSSKSAKSSESAFYSYLSNYEKFKRGDKSIIKVNCEAGDPYYVDKNEYRPIYCSECKKVH